MHKTNTITIISICLTLLLFNFLLASQIIYKNYNFQNPQSLNSLNSYRVIDGDTFEYNNTIIRLLCIQTPERNQADYEQSTSYLSSLLSQGTITLKQQDNIDKDMYNRSLRFVYIQTENETLFVNKIMIDSGYASLFPFNNTNCSLLED